MKKKFYFSSGHWQAIITIKINVPLRPKIWLKKSEFLKIYFKSFFYLNIKYYLNYILLHKFQDSKYQELANSPFQLPILKLMAEDNVHIYLIFHLNHLSKHEIAQKIKNYLWYLEYNHLKNINLLNQTHMMMLLLKFFI